MEQYHQAAEDVDDHDERVEHPQVVQVLHNLLELGRDVDVDVVVETGLHRTERGQRGPVVRPASVGTVHQLRLAAFQLLRFLLQLVLAPLGEGEGISMNPIEQETATQTQNFVNQKFFYKIDYTFEKKNIEK